MSLCHHTCVSTKYFNHQTIIYPVNTQHLGNHWTWQNNLLCRQLAQKLNVHEPVKLFWSFGFQWLTRQKFLMETRDQCKLIKPDFLSQSRAGWVYVVECLASQIWVSVSAPLNRQILSISRGSYFSVHYFSLFSHGEWQSGGSWCYIYLFFLHCLSMSNHDSIIHFCMKTY